MIADTWTVARKEAMEIAASAKGRGRLSPILLIGIFGILAPARLGADWVDTGFGLFLAVWVPLLIVISVIADAFAGERERHTLETLLASRLPDRAILFGKILVVSAYGWSASLVVTALGLVTVNAVHRHDGFVRYSVTALAAGLAVAIVAPVLTCAIGALVSLRAATVRQAQQLLTTGVVAIAIIPGFGSQLVPAGVRRRLTTAADRHETVLLLAAVSMLVTVTAALLWLACTRFQRSRLLAP